MEAYNFISESGIIIPDTESLKEEVQTEYTDVFGEELNLSDETPEGLFISAETASRTGVATNNAAVANQINPNLAGGPFLDATWALTGGARSGNSKSTFTTPPTLTGQPGTIIPAGSIASETVTNNEFATVAELTLDGAGQGSVNFQAVETGPVECAAGTLTNIVSNVLGWETVTNSVGATLGIGQQSDISARLERNDTLALQARSVTEAVFGNIRAVTGVTSLTFRENITNAPVTIDGVDLVAHSIWACVAGGTDADVAAALLGAKTDGANWNNGNSSNPVTENVLEPISGQLYLVELDRPDDIPVLVQVTIKPTTVTNATKQIKEAVVAYANGEIDGEPGLVVGGDVSPWDISGAISSILPGIKITLLEVTTVAAASFAVATIPIPLFQEASLDEDSVTVIIS